MNKKLCIDCIKEMNLDKKESGSIYYLCSECKIEDAIEYLRKKRMCMKQTECANCGWHEISCGSCGGRGGLKGWINFSKEELEDMISNFQQCVSEGYLEYGDDAYNAMLKIQEELDKCSKVNDDF